MKHSNHLGSTVEHRHEIATSQCLSNAVDEFQIHGRGTYPGYTGPWKKHEPSVAVIAVVQGEKCGICTATTSRHLQHLVGRE